MLCQVAQNRTKRDSLSYLLLSIFVLKETSVIPIQQGFQAGGALMYCIMFLSGFLINKRRKYCYVPHEFDSFRNRVAGATSHP